MSDKMREALEAIKQATIDGRVCDDVAWFDTITTLHDFCDQALAQAPPSRPVNGGSWDEGEHEGCGIDSDRAFKDADLPTFQEVRGILPLPPAAAGREEIENAFVNLCQALGLQATASAYLDAPAARDAILALGPTLPPQDGGGKNAD